MNQDQSCVIVVENLAVPFDRRVWQEAQSLRRAGWRVSVICPMSERHPASFEEVEGVAIYRHPLPVEARRPLAFLVEYAFALFHELRLLIKVHRERGFSIIQVCNPPDLMFLVALPFKILGKRLVFDQHDVSPELFFVKFGRRGLFYNLLLLAEWLTFKSADFVISSNATFRELALARGGVSPNAAEVVYGVPDKNRIFRTLADNRVRHGKKFVLGYLGIIGDQDGLDHVIYAVHHLLRFHQFEDFHTVIVGDGPALISVRALAERLGVARNITFAGYLTGEELLRHISAFDIGVIPDPINEANDKMTMNKVFEYSALGIPTATYPLTETRRLLGDAAVYATSPYPRGLASACLRLMVDDELRGKCADSARRLAESFSWDREAKKYVSAFERVLSANKSSPRSEIAQDGVVQQTAERSAVR